MGQRNEMMASSNRKDGLEETIYMMNSPNFLLMLGFGVFAILIMQSLWDTVSGLYFNHAYEAIIIPFTMYLVFKLYGVTVGQKINKGKIVLMLFTFMMLFAPALYLLITNQVTFHEMIFSEFNHILSHLPFSHVLTFLALAALLLPYKDFLTKE
jgi:hypothetical protein